MYSFVRCAKVLSRGHLGAMQRHARGQDSISRSRRREDANEYRALAWDFDQNELLKCKLGSRKLLNVTDAFEHHLAVNKVEALRKGAPIALHLIVGVSDEWVTENGDLHDPNNRRNSKLLRTAVGWAEQELGGCFSARLDLDEKGGAVVDIFLSPIDHKKTKRKTSVTISTHKALKRLADKHNQVMSFSALQDSCTEYANEHLGAKFDRGESKAQTRRENMRPEEYAKMAEAQKKIEADRATLDAEKAEHLSRIEKLRQVDDTLKREHAEREQESARRVALLQQEAEEIEARKTKALQEAAAADERAKKSRLMSRQLLRRLKASLEKLKNWQEISATSKQWRSRLKKCLTTVCGIPRSLDKGAEFWWDLLLLCFGIKRLDGCFAADIKLANADRSVARIDQVIVALKQRHEKTIERYTKSVEIADRRSEISDRYKVAYRAERETQTKIKAAEIPDLIEMATDADLDLTTMNDNELTEIANKSLRGVTDENVKAVVRRVRRELKGRGIEPARSRSRKTSRTRPERDPPPDRVF